MAAPPRRAPRGEVAPPLSGPTPAVEALLPATLGHVATGSNPPPADPAWIHDRMGWVEEAFRWSRRTGRECGFLAYLPREEGAEPLLEELTYGTKTEIAWRWEHMDATVAYTFHTHPGAGSIATPSGLDVIGATVRGDHVHYILDMQGRLVGWRFRAAHEWPRAIQESVRALADAHKLDRTFVKFLTEAMDVMMPRFMEPCFGAQLTLLDEGGMLITPADPRKLLGGRV